MFIHKPVEIQKLEAVTTPVGRIYKTPDGPMPSITTVLSRLSREGIAEWRDRVGEKEANRISNVASYRGNRIHKFCEEYIQNLEPNIKSPFDRNMFNSIKKLIDKYLGTVYGQELPLYSKTLGVAGRADLIAEWNGKLAVIDFKTSDKLKEREWIDGYLYQSTAYCIMFEEITGISVRRVAIIIGVEGEPAQTFYGKRDDNIAGLINAIGGYYEENNLIHPNPGLFDLRF